MKEHKQLMKIAFTGLMAALSYVVFTFLQIKIPLPGGDATSIHLGNAICVLGALLLGGLYGGLGGAIGLYCLRTENLLIKIMHRFNHRTCCPQNRTHHERDR